MASLGEKDNDRGWRKWLSGEKLRENKVNVMMTMMMMMMMKEE